MAFYRAVTLYFISSESQIGKAWFFSANGADVAFF